MADNAMSWYLIRQREMKLVLWGTGVEHPAKLYNITADPNEDHDLGADPAFAGVVRKMTATLSSALNYSAVSLDVADYNKKMFVDWYANQSGFKGSWKDWLPAGPGGRPAGLPGGGDGAAWPADLVPEGVAAVESWLSKPPGIAPCRGTDWTPEQ